MLTNLRERSQRSFGVLILFGMLTFIFIFFFGPQSEGCQPRQEVGRLDGWAARVNGVELSQREVENIVYARGSRKSEAELVGFRYDILTSLVDQELLAQRAVSIGIDIDDDGLTRYITSDENPDFPAFVDDDGNFDPKVFGDALRYRLGVGPNEYRERKRREFLANRYRRFLEAQVQVSDSEVRAEVEKRLRNWNLDFLKFSPSKYEAAEASTEEVSDFISKEEKSIKAFYDTNKTSRFVKGREVKARRVLIKKPDDKGDKAAIKAARAKIEALYAKATAEGTDFGKLAAENSEGMGDKEKSGDMGFIRPGAAFYKKVFEPLKVGEVSDIQDENIGFFFVKAEAEKPALNQTFEQVKSTIASELLAKRSQSAAAKEAASQALTKLKAGTDLASLAKPAEPSEDGEARSASPLPVLAETGPIGDGPRYGQPWDRIPNIGARSLGARSSEVARALRSLTKEKPLIDRLVEIEGEQYIFRLKNKSEGDDAAIKAALEATKESMLRMRRNSLIYGESGGLSGDPLAAFRAQLRSGNTVTINEELYPKPAAPDLKGLPPGLKLNLGGAK